MIASIDTNALVSYLTKRNIKQYQAVVRLMDSNHTLHISDYVFSEIEYLFARGLNMSRENIAHQFALLLDNPVFNCNRGMMNQVMPLYLDRPGLSFIDCCLAVQAELNGAAPLYTFDKKLANQAKGIAKLIKA